MLANSSIMLVKSTELRVSFSILSIAKLFNLLWLIDARRYVKINFSLLTDLSQDAIETETVSNICNAILKFRKTSSLYEMININSSWGLMFTLTPVLVTILNQQPAV